MNCDRRGLRLGLWLTQPGGWAHVSPGTGPTPASDAFREDAGAIGSIPAQAGKAGKLTAGAQGTGGSGGLAQRGRHAVGQVQLLEVRLAALQTFLVNLKRHGLHQPQAARVVREDPRDMRSPAQFAVEAFEHVG